MTRSQLTLAGAGFVRIAFLGRLEEAQAEIAEALEYFPDASLALFRRHPFRQALPSHRAGRTIGNNVGADGASIFPTSWKP